MIIKICGLTETCEVEYLKKNKVDFAGVVMFYEKSKRNTSVDKAKQIVKALHESDLSMYSDDSNLDGYTIKAVAVTVAPTLGQVKAIEAAGFDYIQIHGALDEDLVREINIPILKAFNVNDMDKYDYYLSFDNIKGFVFDAGEPGSGKTFDWDTLDSIKRDEGRLYILAGGLNSENVKRAIENVKPDGVDVSSAVELPDVILEDGSIKTGKDPKLIDEFVEAVRN